MAPVLDETVGREPDRIYGGFFPLLGNTRRTKAYELARHISFPCLVIRVGDLYRVSTADLLRLLGTSPEELQTPPTAA